MPTFRSIADFGDELGKLGADLTTREKYEITDGMGRRAQKLAEQAASADLGGDPMMSGWKVAELKTRTRRLADGATLLSPASPAAAGGWTVASDGRNQGNAGGFFGPGIIQSGPNAGTTARTKSGKVRKVRARALRRWNGTTRGKDTASDAVALMEREMPKLAEQGVKRVIRKRFDVS